MYYKDTLKIMGVTFGIEYDYVPQKTAGRHEDVIGEPYARVRKLTAPDTTTNLLEFLDRFIVAEAEELILEKHVPLSSLENTDEADASRTRDE